MLSKYPLYIILLITTITSGQEDYLIQIQASWDQYSEAFINKDFQKVVTLTHPMVVEKSGGPTYYINDLLYDSGMFESAGLKIVALNARQPSQVIAAGEELHAMLPYERVIMAGEEKITESFFALAASQDNGKTWTFFDLSKQDEASIKIYLPHYNDRLNVYLRSNH